MDNIDSIKKSWNYGLKKVGDKDDETLPDEPKLTLREHMLRRLDWNEFFLLVALILLIAIFLYIFLNPLENPLKENERYNNL